MNSLIMNLIWSKPKNLIIVSDLLQSASDFETIIYAHLFQNCFKSNLTTILLLAYLW